MRRRRGGLRKQALDDRLRAPLCIQQCRRIDPPTGIRICGYKDAFVTGSLRPAPALHLLHRLEGRAPGGYSAVQRSVKTVGRTGQDGTSDRLHPVATQQAGRLAVIRSRDFEQLEG